MFKRIILPLTFAAAFSAAGLCLTNNADARWGRGYRPYASYYGPRAAYGYGYGVPYRSYYRGYGYYGPGAYNYSCYGGTGNYYYRPVARVAVQVGPVWR